MRLNENVALLSHNLALVPYKKHHVLKYNSWMQQRELQELTASEPLSLKEEYEMQISWHTDEKKLTFIIMDKQKWFQIYNKISLKTSGDGPCIEVDGCDVNAEAACMIGDVNLFCNGESWSNNAELSLMIAETSYRRKGLGTEAAKTMMMYAINELNVKTFMVKISVENTPSICMFEDKLCFEQVGQSNIFNEITLQYCVASNYDKQFKNLEYEKIHYVLR